MSTTIRIPEDLLEQIEAHRQRLGAQVRDPSRSEAVRDLLKRGLSTVGATRPVTIPYRLAPMVRENVPPEGPWAPLVLSGEEGLRLESYAFVGLEGRVVDIAFEPISGRTNDLRISLFRIVGGADLMPYEGDHPLSSWRGVTFSVPGRPRLRVRPILRSPNRAMATVSLAGGGAGGACFRLFAVLVPGHLDVDRIFGGVPGEPRLPVPRAGLYGASEPGLPVPSADLYGAGVASEPG